MAQCGNCSAEFKPSLKHKKFCSVDCRKSVKKARDLVWCQANYEKKNAAHARYRQRNPQADRRHNIKQKYGITQEQYESLWRVQEGVCGICKEPETTVSSHNNKTTALCVDHDHKTGRVRGLLCRRCNFMLGSALDDESRLTSAVTYLRFHLLGATE